MDIFFQVWVLILENLTGCLQRVIKIENYKLFFYQLHPEEFGKDINFQFQDKNPRNFFLRVSNLFNFCIKSVLVGEPYYILILVSKISIFTDLIEKHSSFFIIFQTEFKRNSKDTFIT